MDYKIKRKKIKAKLLWYNPAAVIFSGRGQSKNWHLGGKGYGELEDQEGNRYFVYGQELGGGMHGEDADPKFIKPNREYVITSYWASPHDGSQESFFMGHQFRIRSIELKNGNKPGITTYAMNKAKILKLEKEQNKEKAA